MIPAVLVEIEQPSSSTYTFWLRTERPFNYTAGQFIEMYIPHEADDRGTHRWFTLSSAPSEKYIAITTRKAATMSTFKQHLFSAKPGDTLHISQAMGDFVLPMQRSMPLIFIVRGIGITPVRSMVKQLVDEGSRSRDITIIHSVKYADDLLFQNIYKQITSEITEYIEDSKDYTEDIVIEAKNSYHNKPGGRIYISGPEQFAEKIYNQLKSEDIKPGALITDYFHGYNA